VHREGFRLWPSPVDRERIDDIGLSGAVTGSREQLGSTSGTGLIAAQKTPSSSIETAERRLADWRRRGRSYVTVSP